MGTRGDNFVKLTRTNLVITDRIGGVKVLSHRESNLGGTNPEKYYVTGTCGDDGRGGPRLYFLIFKIHLSVVHKNVSFCGKICSHI